MDKNANSAWGSDVVADLLHALDYPYAVIVPGASFRGLHDSIVNRLGNENPKLVTCLHENHAVTIADGYSRVTETPLLVILHSNVGVMNGSMGIYNAWCDRRPMLILGATGPVDAHHRRPWIDWVHTSKDQGALIRSYVKWDDQPASAEAAVESILRADQITRSLPSAPVYVCLDAHMQEGKLEREVHVPPVSRYRPAPMASASERQIADIDRALRAAKNPLILAGRVSRDMKAWQARIAFAEHYGAHVLSSLNNAPAFPVTHPLHILPPAGDKPSAAETDLIAASDLILSLDWLDLAGFLRARTGRPQTQLPLDTQIIHASVDSALHNGWSMDLQALPAVDMPVACHPDALVEQLLAHGGARVSRDGRSSPAHWCKAAKKPAGTRFDLRSMADAVAQWSANRKVTFARLPIGWPQDALAFEHPLDFLGKDGGGAVGTGPAHTVGAALALKGSDRIVAGIIGDGDFLMGMNALWTASNQNLPMLLIAANNRSYYNDEVHQERVALQRGRPVENKSIGQKLDNPAVDLSQIAAAQGFETQAPVMSASELAKALEAAARVVGAGGRYFIDARVEPGYMS